MRTRRAHQPSYPQSIRATTGTRLRVTSRPEPYPGWVWCTAGDGIASWVPEEFLDVRGDEATLLRDYDATELGVEEGEVLEELERVAGWVRCRRASGAEGWIPGDCLGR